MATKEEPAPFGAFGKIKNYIEPFFGSGAVLLNRPLPFEGSECVNDADGLCANFWRAVQADPKAVAKFAAWPTNENDMHARHIWLVERKNSLQLKLEGDPEFFDAKVAGWWCWGLACWIGSGFCSGNGPWRLQEIDGVRQLVHLSNAGRGVNRNRVHLSNAGQGVNRNRVHLGDAGRGVNRNRVALSTKEDGKAGRGECGLLAWMQSLCGRLERVRVCCGDWKRVCGGDSGDALAHFFVSGTPCGVFLDPPYADTAMRAKDIYRVDCERVAHEVREWAIAHGDDERLRIIYCSYGEDEVPRGWKRLRWKTQGGMSGLSKGKTQGRANALREVIDFSPHCVMAGVAESADSETH